MSNRITLGDINNDPYSLRNSVLGSQREQPKHSHSKSFDNKNLMNRRRNIHTNQSVIIQSKHDTSFGSDKSQNEIQSERQSISQLSERSSIFQFGIEGYKVAKNERMLFKPKSILWVRPKTTSKQSFIDNLIKLKHFMPGPNKYQQPPNWKKEQSEYFYGGGPFKGSFTKRDRNTFIAEIFKKGKTSKDPSVGSYNPNLSVKKPRGYTKQNSPKGSFLEDEKYVAMQIPGPKYNADLNSIKPSVRITRFDNKKYSDNIKIQRKTPSIGQYDIETSFKRSQLPFSNFGVISKVENKRFIDIYKKNKEYLPGVGHYEVNNRSFERLSSGPHCLRSKRH